jgi:hypothetical protein
LKTTVGVPKTERVWVSLLQERKREPPGRVFWKQSGLGDIPAQILAVTVAANGTERLKRLRDRGAPGPEKRR